MLEVTDCPVCGCEAVETLTEHTFRHPGDDVAAHRLDKAYARLHILFSRIVTNSHEARFRCERCVSCGFVFLAPRFTDAEMDAKYAAVAELGSVKARLEARPATGLSERARRVHTLLTRMRDAVAVGGADGRRDRVLDYGGARGDNLEPFIREADCFVLDSVKWPLPEGLSYLGHGLDDLGADERFDTILLLHTLEHVTWPRELLAALAAHLSIGGVIYVEVPLGGFAEWRSLEDPLTHVNFFDEGSLLECMEGAGLEVAHLDSRWQWVTHGKTWCVNAIGRSPFGAAERPPGVRPRRMSRLRYALPYLPRRLRGLALRALPERLRRLLRRAR